jgi:hypothetical protein
VYVAGAVPLPLDVPGHGGDDGSPDVAIACAAPPDGVGDGKGDVGSGVERAEICPVDGAEAGWEVAEGEVRGARRASRRRLRSDRCFRIVYMDERQA